MPGRGRSAFPDLRPGAGRSLGPPGGAARAARGDAAMCRGSWAAASTRAGRGGRWALGGAPSRHRPPSPSDRTPPGCGRRAAREPPPRRRRRPALGTLGNTGRGDAESAATRGATGVTARPPTPRGPLLGRPPDGERCGLAGGPRGERPGGCGT